MIGVCLQILFFFIFMDYRCITNSHLIYTIHIDNTIWYYQLPSSTWLYISIKVNSVWYTYNLILHDINLYKNYLGRALESEGNDKDVRTRDRLISINSEFDRNHMAFVQLYRQTDISIVTHSHLRFFSLSFLVLHLGLNRRTLT